MKCSHCNSKWNTGAGVSLTPTCCPFCGQSLVKEEPKPCEKCPVCENPLGAGATKCDNCGFADELGVNREWVNTEDADCWFETVVKKCRAVWEAARKREAGLLEDAKNKMAEPTSFTDPRDGQTYRTVKIGGLVWMAENLNYKVDDSLCYNNDESNGEKYGRLYTWKAAKVACPDGWHLPSKEEWNTLVRVAVVDKEDWEELIETSAAGEELKSKTGWNNTEGGNNGTDKLEFSAMPGGYRDSYGSFCGVGEQGNWWNAEGDEDAEASFMGMTSDNVCETSERDVRDWLSVRCVEGDRGEQNNLGNRYANGEGVTQDYEKAVYWYTKAAEQGDPNAQCNLGHCYANGEGVTQDYKKAVYWYTKAAEQGDPDAQCELGVCYQNGTGVTQDYGKAVSWYTKAAEQGDVDAKKNLAALGQLGNVK